MALVECCMNWKLRPTRFRGVSNFSAEFSTLLYLIESQVQDTMGKSMFHSDLTEVDELCKLVWCVFRIPIKCKMFHKIEILLHVQGEEIDSTQFLSPDALTLSRTFCLKKI